ncbi:MAG: ABC transporter permease [Verrucomicrobia bacterium]|nr:ABC transporter permease [Verrucomicrobiota bacterium]
MWLDLRFAVRMLLKQPGYSVIAILAIALGISTTTSQFTFFNALLIRPMPYLQDESRVVIIRAFKEQDPRAELGLPLATYLDLRERTKTLQGCTISQARTYILSGIDPVERVLGGWISAAGFPMLGVQPALGRNFRPEEEGEDAARVAILGHALWKRSYDANKEIIGQTVTLNGEPTTIVGVMPEGFAYPDNYELWMPFSYDSEKKNQRTDFSWPVVARIKPGVSLQEVMAEIQLFAKQMAIEHPLAHRGIGMTAVPLREEATRRDRPHMLMIFASCLAVLLIACGNVANLMLAKGASRSREIAIRLALGASRRRIASLVLIESAVLALAGGVIGTILAAWRNDLVVAMLPSEMPFWLRFEMDWRVILYSFGLTLFSALLAGLLPAIHTSRADLGVELKDGGTRGSTASRESARVRSALVVFQIAVALILLVGAGLFFRSFRELQNSDPGMRPEGVLTFRVGLPPTQYKDETVVRDFWVKLRQQLRELPGVEASGVVADLPSTSQYSYGGIYVEGRPMPRSLAEAPSAFKRMASPGAIEALGIPLLRGRLFNDADTIDSPRVCVVDRAFAEEFFPNEDAIGKRITDGPLDSAKRQWFTIVGIVGNARQEPKGPLPERSAWFAQTQSHGSNFATGVVRVKSGDPMQLAASVQHAVFTAMPDIPIYNVRSLGHIVQQSFWQQRFFSRILLSFSGTALFLAAIGIYGVMSYSVAQRTQEIGVRMALGAQPRDVIRLVLRQGLVLVAAGLAAGFIGSWMVAHLLEAYLYQIRAHDPPTFALVPLMLAAVAVLACWLPSRRATRIQPVVALRES